MIFDSILMSILPNTNLSGGGVGYFALETVELLKST
jgi:hypothetical protein